MRTALVRVDRGGRIPDVGAETLEIGSVIVARAQRLAVTIEMAAGPDVELDTGMILERAPFADRLYTAENRFLFHRYWTKTGLRPS